MNFWQLLILAVIQSFLEWLPVSSQGFVVLTAVNLFGDSAENAFRIALYFHFGTALAVFLKYWRKYWDALTKDRSLLRFLFLATLGTGIVAIPLYLLLKNIFSETAGVVITLLIGLALVVTGFVLRSGKITPNKDRKQTDRYIWEEFSAGVCQGFAILPGISRSGTTVSFFLLRGFNQEDAFTMSFLLSLPAVVAAIGFDLLFESDAFVFHWSYLVLVAVVCGLGYLFMNVLLRWARQLPFEKICFLLGSITIVLCLILIGVGSVF